MYLLLFVANGKPVMYCCVFALYFCCICFCSLQMGSARWMSRLAENLAWQTIYQAGEEWHTFSSISTSICTVFVCIPLDFFSLYSICICICICSLTNHLSSQRRVAHFSKLFQSLVVQCLNNCCIVVFHFVLYLWCGKPSIKVAKNGGLLFCTISCLVIVVVVVLL